MQRNYARIEGLDAAVEARWHDIARLVVTGFVHALTLGNALSFGSYVENLSLTLRPLDYDVLIIGETLLGILLLTGSILDLVHSALMSSWCGQVLERDTRDRIINLAGVFLWTVGFATSIPLVERYEAFAGVVSVFGGIGSGLLYWNTWAMLPTWVPIQSREFPLAVLWLAVCPQAYVALASYFSWGLELHREAVWDGAGVAFAVSGSLWAFAYTILVPFWAIGLAMSAFYLVASPPENHLIQPEIRDRPAYRTPTPRWVDHPHPVVYFCFLCVVGLFQAVSYVPYVFLPTFVSSSPRLGSLQDTATVMTVLAWGGAAGKVLATIALSCTSTGAGCGHSSMQAALKHLRAWASLLLITACTWITIEAVPNTMAYAFFFGLFAGGVGLCSKVGAYSAEPSLVLGYSTTALISAYAFAQAVGQTIGTFAAHYSGATTLSYVYVTVGFGAAIWVAAVALPDFAASQAKRM